MKQNANTRPLRYSEICDEDIDTVSALAERYLTHGDYIQNAIDRETPRQNYLGIKARDGENIVGFFTFKEGIDFTTPHPALEQKIRSLSVDGSIFNVDAVYVDSAYRHGGMGAEMMRRALSVLRTMDVKYLLFEFWIYPDGKIPALHLPDSDLRIVYEERLERFYRDLPRYGMACPICGRDCKCGALIRLFAL